MKSRAVSRPASGSAGPSDSCEVAISSGLTRSGKVRNRAGTSRSSVLSACRSLPNFVTLLPGQVHNITITPGAARPPAMSTVTSALRDSVAKPRQVTRSAPTEASGGPHYRVLGVGRVSRTLLPPALTACLCWQAGLRPLSRSRIRRGRQPSPRAVVRPSLGSPSPLLRSGHSSPTRATTTTSASRRPSPNRC